MNRKIFVTGATSGIGLECARAFAQDGDNVLIAGRRADRLAAIKEDFEQQYGIRVDTLVLDVSKREDVDAKVKPAIEAFGGIDVLVNNAGLAQGLDPFQDSTVEDAVTMINTNVLGLLYVTKAVLTFMDTIATDIKVTTIQPGIVETPFSEVRFHGDAERAKSVYAGIDAIQPEDVADVVLYVTNQPKRLQISDVTIMANQQAAGFMVHKK
ncbi:MAG: SDR family NAD(P)-dependent oxidoreductase [Veillonella sp.]|uniref:SDR family NAD(P)-dependent oxidoreductase n=1 Tax=Veillonella sp. TaxID=1926307 RepID=UPI00258061C3|nr:SDR family NAD(P)-dependent oxidoreductase [Veillonella sp.]MBS5755455.1 SDR family NAD(P)-dependent oxidoreductase [Veillonella sp.]